MFKISFEVSCIIAKDKMPHNIGELLPDFVAEMHRKQYGKKRRWIHLSEKWYWKLLNDA